jgi:hypothetical protein
LAGSLARGTRPSPLSASAFTRRLAALEPGAAPAEPDAFTPTLSRWFTWTDAIALSAALGPLPAAPAQRGADAAARDRALAREAARVRAGLHAGIAELGTGRPAQPGSGDEAEGFAPWRERVAARQQAMEAALAPLRRRARAALAAGTPAQARVAALDAVFEQALAPRERELLTTVPRWLERHFGRRPPAPTATAAFRRDLVELLHAELDFRMQPVEGLLAALVPPDVSP